MPPIEPAPVSHEFQDLAQDCTVAGATALLRAAARLAKALAEALRATGLCRAGQASKEAQLFVGSTYEEVFTKALDGSLDALAPWAAGVESARDTGKPDLSPSAPAAQALLSTFCAFPGPKRLRVVVAGKPETFDLPDDPLTGMQLDGVCLSRLQLAMATIGSAVLQLRQPPAPVSAPSIFAVLLTRDTAYPLPAPLAAALLQSPSVSPLLFGELDLAPVCA